MDSIKSSSIFQGTALAATILSNTWDQSIRFYKDTLGYSIVGEGELSAAQNNQFGQSLKRYCLFGQDRGAVIRLIELADHKAVPNRLHANPWDPGLAVMEVGVADVDKLYHTIIRNRFGILAPPTTFSVKGPEPLGFVEMRALAVLGPSGEQIFFTQITQREGGTPLWEQRRDINVFPLGNIVLSMKDRNPQQFYKDVFQLMPSIDLVLKQKEAAFIMGGPQEMAFDMCLMGNGHYKSGMEQHVYGPHNPEYTFNTFPVDFSKTGLASACWGVHSTENLEESIRSNGGEVLGQTLLPIRDMPTPSGVVFRGKVGEVIELVQK